LGILRIECQAKLRQTIIIDLVFYSDRGDITIVSLGLEIGGHLTDFDNIKRCSTRATMDVERVSSCLFWGHSNIIESTSGIRTAAMPC
jgi:hypothetical protein